MAWHWYEWKGPKPLPFVVDYMAENYPPDFTYADFGPQFSASFFEPDRWADIFKASGARYD
jgi:alpha-L-fucosidase